MIAAMQMYETKAVFSPRIAKVAAMTDAEVRVFESIGKIIKSFKLQSLEQVRTSKVFGQMTLMQDMMMGHTDKGMRTTTKISMARKARWLTFLRIVRISL